jgi:hypothetical protein
MSVVVAEAMSAPFVPLNKSAIAWLRIPPVTPEARSAGSFSVPTGVIGLDA